MRSISTRPRLLAGGGLSLGVAIAVLTAFNPTGNSALLQAAPQAAAAPLAAPQAAPAPQAQSQLRPDAIPRVLAGITASAQGRLVFGADTPTPGLEFVRPASWTLDQVRGNPRGTDEGIAFDFGKPDFVGTLVFGLVPYHDTRFPQPVYRASVAVAGGKAEINIKTNITDRYDMVGWQKAGTGVLGYRLISQTGLMIYDGRVRFTGTGPFTIGVTMVEGPFVANVGPRDAVIAFTLDRPAPCSVTVAASGVPAASGLPAGGPSARSLPAGSLPTRTFPCRDGAARQEITLDALRPATGYEYSVRYGAFSETYGFRTAPLPGSRRPFVFAYASDSRGGQGGGERNFSGPNGYIVRRLMAVATSRDAAFMQFTGDLVGGYVNSPDALRFELANWKRAIEPQAHWMPVYTGMGNHDSVVRDFSGADARTVRVDRFPYETESAEAVFARELVNPENGPASEDGGVLDPDPTRADFPPYRRNVFWYQYDNVAMVVLNSDYWISPSIVTVPQSGGNLHGYLMEQQMAWLARTLTALERNTTVDHVFITTHAPVFPNGGHVGDTMWYGGSNAPRPTIAGTPVAKGIIECRDDLLTLIQAHPKVVAVLTGDEHNYARMRLDPTVPIYPAGWDKARVQIARPFYQINNGAAGAPYYAQEMTPWSAAVRGFSTQHAICLLIVEGPRVRLETVNPETLEVLDREVLR